MIEKKRKKKDPNNKKPGSAALLVIQCFRMHQRTGKTKTKNKHSEI
jgi:hypothetical protein